MAETKIPRGMALQVLAEDQSSKEQLEAKLKHPQGIDKFRILDLKLIRQELKEWLKGLESKKTALHSLIKQITLSIRMQRWKSRTMPVVCRTRLVHWTIPRTGLMPVNISHSSRKYAQSSSNIFEQSESS